MIAMKEIQYKNYIIKGNEVTLNIIEEIINDLHKLEKENKKLKDNNDHRILKEIAHFIDCDSELSIRNVLDILNINDDKERNYYIDLFIETNNLSYDEVDMEDLVKYIENFFEDDYDYNDSWDTEEKMIEEMYQKAKQRKNKKCIDAIKEYCRKNPCCNIKD